MCVVCLDLDLLVPLRRAWVGNVRTTPTIVTTPKPTTQPTSRRHSHSLLIAIILGYRDSGKRALGWSRKTVSAFDPILDLMIFLVRGSFETGQSRFCPSGPELIPVIAHGQRHSRLPDNWRAVQAPRLTPATESNL